MDFYVGEIRAFAGSYAPSDFLMCDGSILSINSYQLLFAVIGTTYGGDGISTFGLPDLRGRLIVGQGQGTGLTNRPLGSKAGSETVALAQGTIPSHTHTVTVSTVTNPASVNAPSAGSSYLGAINPTSGTGVGVGYVPSTATGVVVKALETTTITSTGSGQVHANLMPFLCVAYIICTNGIYPQQP